MLMRIEYTLRDTGRTFHEPVSSTLDALSFLDDCATYGSAKAELQGFIGRWVNLDVLNDHFEKGRKGRLQCAV